jgi:hypothetical protein
MHTGPDNDYGVSKLMVEVRSGCLHATDFHSGESYRRG